MHYKSSKYIPQICLCNIMRLKNIFKVFVNNNQTLDLNYSDVDKKKRLKFSIEKTSDKSLESHMKEEKYTSYIRCLKKCFAQRGVRLNC